MRTFMIAVLLLTGLSACASPYGNYAKLTDAYNQQMAEDTAHKLAEIYPPASTHLLLAQTTEDAYGQALLSKLRASGYAVQDGSRLSNLLSSVTTETASPSSIPFGYVVDSIGDGLTRVTVKVDGQVLSRVYSTTGHRLVAAGAWTRKE